MGLVLILVALFAVMYVLMIRPQRNRANAQMKMQDALRADDEIITAGGMHGRVKAIEDDVVHVEIAPGTTVRVDRRAIAAVAAAEESEPVEEIEDEGKPVPPVDG